MPLGMELLVFVGPDTTSSMEYASSAISIVHIPAHSSPVFAMRVTTGLGITVNAAILLARLALGQLILSALLVMLVLLPMECVLIIVELDSTLMAAIIVKPVQPTVISAMPLIAAPLAHLGILKGRSTMEAAL